MAQAKTFFKNTFLSFHSPLLFLLVGLSLLTSCESQKTIVNALDEKEANEIVVFLSNKGIEAQKVQSQIEFGGGGGAQAILWDITVASDRATEAMAVLNRHGLPRRRGQNLLGIFSKSGLVPSEMEEKIRYQAGLAEQIAGTIRKIDGVLDADIQLSFPEEDPLKPTEKKQKVTASVYVKHSGVLDDPNTHLITKIKRLVASSIPGLEYDNVTVIGDRARFSEIPFNLLRGTTTAEEKQYVSVWTVVVAKESVTRFRVIFFSFFLIVLVLTLLLVWVFWKLYPFLEKAGGIKALFYATPLLSEKEEIPEKETEPEAPPEAPEEKGKKKEPPPTPTTEEAAEEEPGEELGEEPGEEPAEKPSEET